MGSGVETQVLDGDPALREIVARIARAYNPQSIYLFGSKARGTAAADSDYDLLVVVPDDAPLELRKSALARRKLWGMTAPTDVLVCTVGWFQSRTGVRTSLPATVVREGKLLYAA